MVHAYVCGGSNSEDAQEKLAQALQGLKGLAGAKVDAVSSLWQTEPQDYANQPWFCNQVYRLNCEPVLKPLALLRALLALEAQLGRVRGAGPRFGPRAIDLDMLLYGNDIMDTPELVLPHPRMARRAFVLKPLHEIAPGLILPTGESVAGLLFALPHRTEGKRIFQNH